MSSATEKSKISHYRVDNKSFGCYNLHIISKSKSRRVKCHPNGELSGERKDFLAVSVLHPAS